jgi:uncharacterized membrane protein (DUF373 family)
MKINTIVDKIYDATEDVLYYFIAVVLIATGFLIFYDIILNFFTISFNDEFTKWLVSILDRSLLVLMIAEILYTIKVSIKERSLCADPFLIVAIIAAIRRILIISVETAYYEEKFEHFMIEISILGVLVFLFTIALILLRKNNLFIKQKE